jgi:hypothetical protein
MAISPAARNQTKIAATFQPKRFLLMPGWYRQRLKKRFATLAGDALVNTSALASARQCTVYDARPELGAVT